MKMAKTKELLPMDRLGYMVVSLNTISLYNSYSSVWPMFFHKSLWNEVTQMTQIISTVVSLCVSALRWLANPLLLPFMGNGASLIAQGPAVLDVELLFFMHLCGLWEETITQIDDCSLFC